MPLLMRNNTAYRSKRLIKISIYDCVSAFTIVINQIFINHLFLQLV